MNRRQFFLGLFSQRKPTALRVEVMEVFTNPDGPSALLVHHAGNATRNNFAEWLRGKSGTAVVLRLPSGMRIEGRIYRVNSCFGRGLILTRLPAQILPRDVLDIEQRSR
jgi:hypothetical protein